MSPLTSVVEFSDLFKSDNYSCLRFSKDEIDLVMSLLINKISDNEFCFDKGLLKILALQDEIRNFVDRDKAEKYHRLVVKYETERQIEKLKLILQKSEKAQIKAAFIKWLFDYGIKKATKQYSIIEGISYKSELIARNNHCVSLILSDAIFEKLSIRKTDTYVDDINRFEQSLVNSKLFPLEKLNATKEYLQQFEDENGCKCQLENIAPEYLNKITSLLFLHFLIKDLYKIKKSQNGEFYYSNELRNLYKVSLKYFKENRKIRKKDDNADKILSILDYIPLIVRMVLISYCCKTSGKKLNTKYKKFLNEQEDCWNLSTAALLVKRIGQSPDDLKKTLILFATIISNYVEIFLYRFRPGAYSFKQELEDISQKKNESVELELEVLTDDSRKNIEIIELDDDLFDE